MPLDKGKRPTLCVHSGHPPPSVFARRYGMGMPDLFVHIDQFDNVDVYMPGNPARSTDIQHAVLEALKRAAGWPSQPSEGEKPFRSSRSNKPSNHEE